MYEHMIGAERLGAALDLLLSALTINEPLTPSVLRRHLLRLAATMRPEQPVPLTVTVACLLVVGGNADNLECGALATALGTPPLDPNWFSSVTFNMLLCPDGTLTILSELEGVLAPRMFPAQRAVGGGFGKVDALLVRSLTADEAAIILALDDAGQAEQYSQLIVTLLPSAPELLAYHASSASASLALARTLARATSTAGALTVGVHDVLTVIPHFEPFLYGIGTELGAPAASGMLLELVRVALKSPTAALSLGNVAAAAEHYKYLTGRARDLHSSHKPVSERVTFLSSELRDRNAQEGMNRGGMSSADGVSTFTGAGGGANAGGSSGGMGYASMYVSSLLDLIADPAFILVCSELSSNLDAHASPSVSIERILEYRGTGAAVLHHALRGFVSAVRNLPIVARIATELRQHGPQWVADILAELSMPPETEAAPRIIPSPLPELWESMCKASYSKINLEDCIYSVIAQCGHDSSYVRVPHALQHTSIQRMRRTERTVVPFFAKWGYVPGNALSLDVLYATAYMYYDDATAVPEATRMTFIRSVFEAVFNESGTRDAALLGGRKPDESLPTLFVIPNSGGIARLQRGRFDTPALTTMARSLNTLLGPANTKRLGLGNRLVPEGMQAPAGPLAALAPTSYLGYSGPNQSATSRCVSC